MHYQCKSIYVHLHIFTYITNIQMIALRHLFIMISRDKNIESK